MDWAVRIRKTLQIGLFQLACVMVALFKLTGEPKTTTTTPARDHFVHTLCIPCLSQSATGAWKKAARITVTAFVSMV